jgi:UDP-N-acetylglucosamine 2-epimerase (non-hydrolysing)
VKKVLSVVGARPNYMKVAPIYRAFQKYKNTHEFKICHTGQHYDPKMSDSFFNDLDIPYPSYFLNVGSGSHAEQTAKIMIEFEKVLLEWQPDLVVVVGDVNSTLAATLTAKKLNISVAHVEGGLRSNDRTMPEELNRLATDAICDYCFITEEDALYNLSREGFPKERIFFIGNTMIDSLVFANSKINSSQILTDLKLQPKEFALFTLHRPSNVDDKKQLSMLADIVEYTSRKTKIVFPIHPRTRKNIDNFGLSNKFAHNVVLTEPLGYVEFQALLKNSDFVVTDSGGLQEETTFLSIPCLTLRNSTERPITCTIGTNILIPPIFKDIIIEIDKLINKQFKTGSVPYLWDGNAAERIAEIVVNQILI